MQRLFAAALVRAALPPSVEPVFHGRVAALHGDQGDETIANIARREDHRVVLGLLAT